MEFRTVELQVILPFALFTRIEFIFVEYIFRSISKHAVVLIVNMTLFKYI